MRVRGSLPSSAHALLLLAALAGCPPASDRDAAPDPVRDAAPPDAVASDVALPDVVAPDALVPDASGLDRARDDVSVDDANAGSDRDAGPAEAGADRGFDGGLDGGLDGGAAALGWVRIAAGSFVMGSPVTEVGREPDETQVSVTLTHDFELATTEVTQGQFQDLMGYNPAHFVACGRDCPVELVKWFEAAAFCNQLSARAGIASCYQCTGTGRDIQCTASTAFASPYDCPGYRLPTEAEWEYAARAGTREATYRGDLDPQQRFCEQPNPTLDDIAWFCGNSAATTHPAGQLEPNPWGLYDMLGNVWEWCHDGYAAYPSGEVTDPVGAPDEFCVLRGGAFNHGASFSRAAYRYNDLQRSVRITMGFRPARTVSTGEDAG